MEISDEGLVERVKRGDARAFEILIDRHKRMVFNVAYRILGNRDDAEDAAQESFVRCYKSISSFRGGSKFTTWLYSIVSNVCLSEVGKSRWRQEFVELNQQAEAVFPELSEGTEPPEDIAIREDFREKVRELVRSLPPQYRAVITLYHFKGFTYKELSEILDLPVGTIKTHLYRARELLRKAVLERFEGGI
ncbi:MAG TPA: RNA polymerase sigma factor [Candidatus Latescibacteria bacterium]|nr:RNA polymerase sigma factor [Candidatus Latescibacterota bacterium]